MKVLVTGGRNYTDEGTVFKALTRFHAIHGITHVIHGDCPTGTDRIAGLWARNNGVQPVECPALWDFYDKSAGPIRNQAMLDLGPDAVIWFPGGRGAGNMKLITQSAHIPLYDGLQLLKPMVQPPVS